MPQLLQKPPLGGVYCIAWILQGPLDAASWLNWSLFYAGEGGVRDRFLDLWEYLARAPPRNCQLVHMMPPHAAATVVSSMHTPPRGVTSGRTSRVRPMEIISCI